MLCIHITKLCYITKQLTNWAKKMTLLKNHNLVYQAEEIELDPAPKDWFKWNTNASNLNLWGQQHQLCVVEIIWEMLNVFSHLMGDCPIINSKTLAIREAIRTAIKMEMTKIIVESDSLIAISLFKAKLRPEADRTFGCRHLIYCRQG